VFNLDGEVIGVLVAGQAETLNFSVPVARFVDTIEAVRTHFALCRFNVVQDMEEPVVMEEFYRGFAEWYLNSR